MYIPFNIVEIVFQCLDKHFTQNGPKTNRKTIRGNQGILRED